MDTCGSGRFMAHPEYDKIIAEMREAIRYGESVHDPYATHRAFENAIDRLCRVTKVAEVAG